MSLFPLSREKHAPSTCTNTKKDEAWRKLLARHGLGKSRCHDTKSWYELACRVVGHNATCRLCKMTLEEVRFQRIERYDPDGMYLVRVLLHLADSCTVLTKILPRSEYAGRSRKHTIRPVEGLSYNSWNQGKFTSDLRSLPMALVDVYSHDIPEERVRLALPAAMELEDRTRSEVPAGWVDKLKQGDEEATQYMMQPKFRLDQHITVQSLFAFSLPIEKVHIDAYLGNRNIRNKYNGIRYNGFAANTCGVTVADLMENATKKKRLGDYRRPTHKLPFVGVAWDAAEGAVSVRISSIDLLAEVVSIWTGCFHVRQ